ncbi:MAG TPA: ABC transporter permease [Vicinamibacterales bacterium]|nr:ABC transporter permease [Vicinamibacterales bacterium]
MRRWADHLFLDLRFALRTLQKNRAFAALTVACLALGIGVNSTIFSVVDTFAVRPLPFRAPDALVAIATTDRSTGQDNIALSYPELQDVIARTRTFADVAASTGRSLAVSDAGTEPERILGAAVTANLFPTLGIAPARGRLFRADEDAVGAPRVALVSDGLWQRRYAGDPSILGRTITINNATYTVVGVMPPRFQYPGQAQIWIPLTPVEHASVRGNRSIQTVARLKPGATLAQARQDLAAVGAQLETEYLDDLGRGMTASTLRDAMIPSEMRMVVFTLMGAVSLVLLIACANVANLLLSRATIRRREIAVRTALGAGRARIVRQLLTESLVIAIVSAPLGVAIAYGGLTWLTASVPPQAQTPYYLDWSLNPRVLVYTAAIAIVTGLLFGLAPALQAARANVHDALKDGGRTGASSARNRLRSALVVAEIALSLVLLVGASLFMRSFVNLQDARPGIETEALMTLRFYMGGDTYDPPDAIVRRVNDVVRRVEALPAVRSAFASNLVPLAAGGNFGRIVADGMSVTPGQEPSVSYFGVTAHAMQTLGVTIAVGRNFTDDEGQRRSGVAIVNGTLAKRLWPNRPNAIGQRVRLLDDPQHEWLTVVGQVGEFRLFTSRDDRPVPYAFVPYPYDPFRNTGLTIRVAGGAPTAITAAVRDEIHRSDPLLPIFQEQSGAENRVNSFWQSRLMTWLFSIFGVIALALASIGVYGVLSYAVALRTQEIGVRMALGASRRDVFAMVLRDGALLAAIGIGCGVAGAAAVTHLVTRLLYNVSATDPISFTATSACLLVVALVASFVPARRATGVDPMIALRAD